MEPLKRLPTDTGTAFGQNGEATSSMGPMFADFEGRGVLDLWVTDGNYNRFLRNSETAEDGSPAAQPASAKAALKIKALQTAFRRPTHSM